MKRTVSVRKKILNTTPYNLELKLNYIIESIIKSMFALSETLNTDLLDKTDDLHSQFVNLEFLTRLLLEYQQYRKDYVSFTIPVSIQDSFRKFLKKHASLINK